MNRSEKPKFAILVESLAAAFRVDVTEALLEGYWMALDDLELNSVGAGAKRALRECRFMPTANELRSLSGEVRAEHRSVLAWDAFEAAVVRHGGYVSVDFDDPVINATVRNLGGWKRCCEMPADEFDTFLRKDFERVYSALFASGVPADRAAPLLGIHDAECTKSGFQAPKAIRVETGLPSQQRQLARESFIQIPKLKSPEDSDGVPGLHRVERVAGPSLEKDSR
jgi:hypothetical protein